VCRSFPTTSARAANNDRRSPNAADKEFDTGRGELDPSRVVTRGEQHRRAASFEGEEVTVHALAGDAHVAGDLAPVGPPPVVDRHQDLDLGQREAPTFQELIGLLLERGPGAAHGGDGCPGVNGERRRRRRGNVGGLPCHGSVL
jgi:hypothetical protein